MNTNAGKLKSIMTPLVFNANKLSSSDPRLAREAAELEDELKNLHLFKDGVSLEGSIEKDGKSIAAEIHVFLKGRVNNGRKIWENVECVEIRPNPSAKDADSFPEITFFPSENGYEKKIAHSVRGIQPSRPRLESFHLRPDEATTQQRRVPHAFEFAI